MRILFKLNGLDSSDLVGLSAFIGFRARTGSNLGESLQDIVSVTVAGYACVPGSVVAVSPTTVICTTAPNTQVRTCNAATNLLS